MTNNPVLCNESTWAKEALEHLFRDGLSPQPNNYAVYYYYYAGGNPNLRMAMDMLITQYGKLSQGLCDNLYQTYLGLEAESKTLQEASNAIEGEIHKVMEVIDSAATDTNKFSETLDTFSGNLTTSISLDQIRGAVGKVVSETRVMSQQNKRLHAQLSETTQQLTEMRYNLDQVNKESQTDPLTGVGNRKYFNRAFETALSEARENKTNLTVLMVDIDHFKKFNDNHGHLIGDQVLRLVAHTLVENLKGRDIIARFGGEEFVILLPQTSVGAAEKVGNLLRNSLSTKQIKRRKTNESLGVITVSIGAAEYYHGEDSDSLIARADEALYKAKQAGRNRVVAEALTPEQIAAITNRQPEASADAP